MASLIRALIAGSSTVSVNGLMVLSPAPPGTRSSGSPASFLNSFRIQFLIVPPRFENTARTFVVSTTMSRLFASLTVAEIAGATDAAGATGAAGAVLVFAPVALGAPVAPVAPVALGAPVALAPPAPPGRGAGGGITKR